MLGYTREELAQVPLDDLLRRHSGEELRQDAARIASGETDGRPLDRFYVHKDGHEIGARAYASAIRNRDGKAEYFITQFEAFDDGGDHAARALSRRLAFDLELTGLVSELVTLAADELDTGISRILAAVGTFAEADRCGVFRYDGVSDMFVCAPGWVRGESVSVMDADERSAISGNVGRWALDRIARGLTVNIHDVAASEELCAADKAFLAERAVASLVVVPLGTDTSAVRFAGFMAAAPRRWEEQSVAMFEVVTQIAANALERKRVVDVLSETDALMRSYAAGVGQGIWFWGPDPSRIIYANAALHSLYGVPFDESETPTDPRVWLGRVHPDDQDAMNVHLFDALEKAGELEHRALLGDGSERWLYSRAFPLPARGDNGPRVAGVTEDITERKNGQDTLRRRAQFDQLITEIATGFVGISAEALDHEVEAALERLAAVAGVEWGMIEVLEPHREAYVSHEWHAQGAHDFKKLFASVSSGGLHWFAQTLGRNEVVEVCDLDRLPPEAAKEREGLELLDIHCCVHVPIETSGDTKSALALLGRDARSAHEVAQWVPLLTVAARTFSTAFEAARLDGERERRAGMQTFIASLAVDFMSVPVEDLETGIASALESLARYVGVSGAAVFLFGDSLDDPPNVHVWHEEGLDDETSMLDSVPAKNYPWVVEELMQRRAVVIEDIASLPSEAVADRQAAQRFGLRAVIDVPVIADNVVIGFLSLASYAEPVRWPEDTEALLTIAAEMFSNAIAREKLHNERAAYAVLEGIFTKLATDFINLPTARLDSGIEDALAAFGAGAGADYAVLTLMRRGAGELNTIYQWSAEHGVSRSALSLSGQGWIADYLRLGRPVEVSEFSQIPAQATTERAWADSLGIQSFTAVPIEGARGSLGVLALASKTPGRHWLTAAGNLFAVAADMFANVVERIASDAESDAHRDALAHALRIGTMGELAAGIAHEINQPLAAISNFARGINNNLRDTRVDIPDLVKANEKIADLAMRAGEIIRRVRGHVRKEPSEHRDRRLSDLINDTAALIRADLSEHDVQLEVSCDPDLLVRVDSVQIQQVLLNLIRNAIDVLVVRARPHRVVTVGGRKKDEAAVEVSVSDTAGGIGREAAQEMFHQFYTTKEGGLGLGLSISKSIVEAHGGTLSLARNDEHGATFCFTLGLSGKVDP